ncbi:PAS domain S-box protein [Sphaerotilus sp.]|uniref:CHASE domain-containing hybrid sensor histidine kinase/response regulator n=1 Tax=Sphaerotilus sp. TaxID=2093942 RepID=UPI0034E2758E
MYLKTPSRLAARRRQWLVWLLVVLGLGLSMLAAWLQGQSNRSHLDAVTRQEAQRVATQVAQQVLRVELGLLGARGAVLTVGWEALTREAFLRYSQSRNIDVEFPGVRGIGVIRRVRRAQEADFVARAAADGWPSFAVRVLEPHDDDDERMVIQYIEPAARNREAIGLDIGSEPQRRDAALAALRTGRATLTGPITLVQAVGQPRSGFLMLLPVYPDARVAADAGLRVERALGWTYAPLAVQEVLAHLDFDAQAYRLRIADVDAARVTPFYDTASGAAWAGDVPQAQVETAVAGRVWQVTLQASPGLAARQSLLDPRWVGLGGMLVTLLLAGVLLAYLRAEDHARDLRVERERRAVALQTSRDAVVMVDPQGTVFDWNQGAEALFGHAADEIVGKSALEVLVPAEQLADTRQLLSRAARGEALPAFDTQRLDRAGRRIDVSVLIVPLRDLRGVFAGLALSMRDIRPSKQAERDIQQLNATLQERAVALRAALTDVQSTLHAVPALISYWDASSALVRGNLAWHRQFDAAVAAHPGLRCTDLFEPLYPLFGRCVSAALAGQKSLFECALRAPGEDTVWHAQVELLPDLRDGQVVGYHLVLQDITQQALDKARLAAALRESEAFLNTVHTHALVSVTDRSGVLLDANPNFCRITQYSREALIGQNHRIVNAGRHSRDFWLRMWQTIGRGRPWRGEICNRARDGSLYWVDAMIAPIPGADGLMDRFIAIGTDITSRKRLQAEVDRAREQAEERERFLHDITDKVPLRIAYVDSALRFRFVNAAHCVRFGRSREQIIGRTRVELTGQPLPAAVQAHVTAVLGGQPQHYAYEEIDGATGQRTYIEAHLVPDIDASGEVRGFYTVSSDITARHEAERTLRRTMTLLNSVLDASSEVAIIATDAEGCIQVFNRGAERLLGRSAGEMVGRQSHLAFHDRPELDCRRAALSGTLGRPATVADVFTDPAWLCRPREWTYVHRDGHHVPVSLILTPMATDSGGVTGYLAVVIDITRRKEVEQRLEQATARAEAANRAKSEFLANMSHEIRSPLNAVLGLTYLLRQTVLNAEQRTFLDRIKLASDALLHTVNDVLDLSKVEAGQFSLVQAPFDPGQTVSDLVAVMGVHAQGKRLPIRLTLSPALPRCVVGDGMRLSQVLTNLLSNAIKFTERGQVDVVVDWLPGDGQQGTARLEVADTGIGLDADAVQRVFEPFVQADSTTTRRFGGTGLGLSIVRQLVGLMGGRLGVDSTPGVGSTFWAEIPFEVDGAVRLRPVADRMLASDALVGRTILVVDDSDVNREVARRILERKGARVVLAEDGERAVDVMRANQHAVDLVLMDIHMPVMDGFEATRIIRRTLCRTGLPILALTAGVTSDERDGAQAAGMDDFITKPFDPDRLLLGIVERLGLELPPDMTPSTVSVPLATSGSVWPEIAGIDMDRARLHLSQDLVLFGSLLRRFFTVCRPVAPGAHLDDPAERARVVHDVHLLSGNAGTLGMTRLHALAAELEAGLREGSAPQAGALIDAILEEWGRMQQASADFLANVPDLAVPDEACADASADIPPDALEALIGWLNRRNMRATAAFAALAPSLRARLGSADFTALKEAVDNLRFAQAAAALSALSKGLNNRS